MSVIEDQSRSRVEADVEPLTVEILFAEARAHARRRRKRIGAVVAFVIAAIVAMTGGFLWMVRAPQQRSSTQSVSIPTQSDTFPGQFVVWEAPTGRSKGGIEVISSKTGRTLRTLVTNSAQPLTVGTMTDPLSYVVLGFDLTNDGHTLYFNSNSTIDSVSTSGGAVTAVAAGTHPMVSPDTTLLAYRPGASASFAQFGQGASLAVKLLATGRVSTFTMPGVKPGQAVSASWLPDSRHLLLSASSVPVCSPSLACLTYRPGWHDIATVLDVVTGKFASVSPAVAAALAPSASSHLQLNGAALKGAEVRVAEVVTRYREPNYLPDYTEVGTLNVATGKLTWQYRTPAGYEFVAVGALAGASSGDHFIVYRNTTKRSGLYSWSPAVHLQPQPIGATPRLLQFGSYWVEF